MTDSELSILASRLESLHSTVQTLVTTVTSIRVDFTNYMVSTGQELVRLQSRPYHTPEDCSAIARVESEVEKQDTRITRIEMTWAKVTGLVVGSSIGGGLAGEALRRALS